MSSLPCCSMVRLTALCPLSRSLCGGKTHCLSPCVEGRHTVSLPVWRDVRRLTESGALFSLADCTLPELDTFLRIAVQGGRGEPGELTRILAALVLMSWFVVVVLVCGRCLGVRLLSWYAVVDIAQSLMYVPL